jgi:AraC-like DNA-binding protein
MIDIGHPRGTAAPPAVQTRTLAGQSRQAVRLDRHLLMLVTAGRGEHQIDFARYACRAGTLLWARPGQVAGFSGQPGLDAVLVTWPVGYLPELPGAPDDPFGPVCWQLAGEDEDAVIDEVSQLVVDSRRYRGSAAQDLLRHQLATLVLRVSMVRPVDEYPGSAAEVDAFVRFRREVERGFAESRQVAEYADRLRCSVRTLTRACLAVTGRSAKQVVDDRVVLEAKRLLACTDLPAGTIAQRLGFPEQTHFGRLFHRTAGCPPGTFRARHA